MNTIDEVLNDFDYDDYVDVTVGDITSFEKFKKKQLGRIDPEDLGLDY